jgi:hypothetical protein
LDKDEVANNLDKQLVLAFRSMRVTWFCLISHIFAEKKVRTETINVLVRLFLSSCRRLWIVGENLHSNLERDDQGKKRKADDRTSTFTDKKKHHFM